MMSRFELQVGDRLVFPYWEGGEITADVVEIKMITVRHPRGVETSYLLDFSDGSRCWCNEAWLELAIWSWVGAVEPKFSREQIVRMFT